MEWLDQNRRKNCIRIFGIDDCEGESTEESFQNLFNKTLKVRINLTKNTESCFRVGRQKNGQQTSPCDVFDNKKPRAILVRFCNNRDKQKIM